MKKYKLSIVMAVFVAAFIFYFVSSYDKAMRDGQFSDENWVMYYFYLPAEIKNAPKISASYHFSSIEPDGSIPASDSIVFNKATDASELDAWLTSLGFKAVSRDNLESRWFKEGDTDVSFTIKVNPELKTISFTRY